MSSYFRVVPLTKYFLQTNFYGIDIIYVYPRILRIFINANAHCDICTLGTIPLSPVRLVFVKENENSPFCEGTISQWQLTPIYYNRLISQIEQLQEQK